MKTTLQQLQDDLAKISGHKLTKISEGAHPTTEIYFDGAPREVTARFDCGRITLDIGGKVAADELAELEKKLAQAEAEACDKGEEADNWESKYEDCERTIQRIIEASEANDPAKLTAAIETAKKLIE